MENLLNNEPVKRVNKFIEQIKNEGLDCSFCGTAESDVDFLVEGDKAYICDICVLKANDIVKESLIKVKSLNIYYFNV